MCAGIELSASCMYAWTLSVRYPPFDWQEYSQISRVAFQTIKYDREMDVPKSVHQNKTNDGNFFKTSIIMFLNMILTFTKKIVLKISLILLKLFLKRNLGVTIGLVTYLCLLIHVGKDLFYPVCISVYSVTSAIRMLEVNLLGKYLVTSILPSTPVFHYQITQNLS